MAKGTGTYDDPIICDGIFSKTIDGVKKFFKIKTGSSVDTSQFVRKNGDTLNGNYFFSDNCNLYKTNKTGSLRLNASNDGKDGARLVLCGKDNKDYPAEFNLCANDGTSDIQLIGKANGELYWNNKNIVRSVNGTTADTNGNVNFSTITYKGTSICYKYADGTKILIQCFSNDPSKGITTVNFDEPFTTLPIIFGFVNHNESTGIDNDLGAMIVQCYYRTKTYAKIYNYLRGSLNTSGETSLALIAIGR